MKAPYFPLFVNNWLGSGRVSAMTPAEEGAYIRLLCYEWNDEKCSLPTDDLSLATLSRLGVDWKHSAAKIRAMFDEHEGRLYSEKLLSLRMEADTLREKKHSAGVKGMLSRWHNTAITKLLQNDNPTPTPTPTPTEQNKTPEENTDTAPSVPLKGSDTLSKGIPSSTSKSKSRGKCYARVSVNTPLMIRIGSWFNRAPTTLWTLEEANALAAIGEPVPEIALVEEFYKAKHPADKDFRRRNIITMLNNWNGEIDKAHRWETEKDQPRGNQYGGKQTASERRAEQASREYEEHIVVPTL